MIPKKNDNVETSNWMISSLGSEEMVAAKIRAEVMFALQTFRQDHRYTQKQLAEILGVTQGLVSRWENGEENFTINTLAKIARVTDMRLELKFSRVSA